MAEIIYDDGADLSLILSKKVAHHRLRLAGSRARAEA